MSYTFGVATANKITPTIGTVISATSSSYLMCGWFKPTTLTAGRGYWSGNTSIFAKIATTTSEVQIGWLGTTSNGTVTTSGAGIVINEWIFLAVLGSFGALATGSIRVWIGRSGIAPVEQTLGSVTAAVGTLTGVNTIVIGNIGTGGSTSFQGEIGQIVLLNAPAGVTTDISPLPVTLGAITQAEADKVLRDVVLPIYLGVPRQLVYPGCEMILVDTETTSALVHHQLAANVAPQVTPQIPTVSGTAPFGSSQERQPGQPIDAWTPVPTFVRRR